MRSMLWLSCVWAIGIASGCHVVAGYDDLSFPGDPEPPGKLDILLVVDDSPGTIMADKQALFEIAIGELIDELLPRIDDVHVGVITTSLGSNGADSCTEPAQNGRARLVGGELLSWDPSQDASLFRDRLEQIVVGIGDDGCGFEATLEAWYRFLVDPSPPLDIEVTEGVALPNGVDQNVLDQRAAFLRPDSTVVIITLTDENDCSIMAAGQAYLAAQLSVDGSTFHLEPGRAACDSDPFSECCTSCAVPPPSNCMPGIGECQGSLDDVQDQINLRCFNQKQRFGIDFLYDVERYISALTQPIVFDSSAVMHENPLLAGGQRQPQDVIYVGMVGVPWQDIARRAGNGLPDLRKGLDAGGDAVGGLQTPAEMRALGTWDVVLGEPNRYFEVDAKLPTDPLMIESVEERSGTHPITGDAVVSAAAASGALDNPINGHEYDIPMRDDLQYACIFRLTSPIICETAAADCNCFQGDQSSSPLCQDPDNGDYGDEQHFVAAYPGIRHLQVMRGIGDQAVVGSICAAQQVDPAAPSGFQPTVDALIQRLDGVLKK